MKRIAIIPVAGTGMHLRPHTHTLPKPLIPVAGKAILGHIVDAWIKAGMDEFVFVVGYLGTKIKTYIEERYTGKIHFHFVEQEPRLGVGHALWLCRAYIRQASEVVIALGDTILEADLKALLARPENVLCVQKVEDPQNFGVATLDDVGYVRLLEEKPQIPKSNYALVGLYKIRDTALLVEALEYEIESESRKNYNLTDPLMHMVRQGARLATAPVQFWHDCGQKDVLLATNRILLDRKTQTKIPKFPGSVIIPPVYIAPSAVIENSIVGPHVAVDEYSVIRDSIVQNSILGAYSRLHTILRGSVVGNDSSLTGSWHSINIGDNTELDLHS
ncbi:MAG: sugar phosphate nucleotidyltransferase [Sphingobacteriia bacterium]